MGATGHAAAALAAVCVLSACGSGPGGQSAARLVMDRAQPGAYLEVQVGDRDVLAGVGAARGLTWHDDPAALDERFAGVDDPRLNNFTAAARALSESNSGPPP
jgi:hypothetical protein